MLGDGQARTGGQDGRPCPGGPVGRAVTGDVGPVAGAGNGM